VASSLRFVLCEAEWVERAFCLASSIRFQSGEFGDRQILAAEMRFSLPVVSR
jgi:hypothetical protein